MCMRWDEFELVLGFIWVEFELSFSTLGWSGVEIR